MTERKRFLRLYFIGALALWAVAASPGAFNVPNILAPYCMLVAVPILMLTEYMGTFSSILFGSILLPLIFLCYMLFIRDRKNIPLPSKIFVIFAVACSIYWLIAGWPYGLEYQGMIFVEVMYVYNIAFFIALFVLYRRNFKTPSYMSNFIFHWVFLAWLAWVAFPWLGELP